MRALTAERRNSVIAGEQAALAERQRLAREIHDIVGHSLSITLLHVTAARHALQRHADLDDAIDSLAEAETVGRAAMGELRRTVAVIGSPAGREPAATRALRTSRNSSKAAGTRARHTVREQRHRRRDQ